MLLDQVQQPPGAAQGRGHRRRERHLHRLRQHQPRRPARRRLRRVERALPPAPRHHRGDAPAAAEHELQLSRKTPDAFLEHAPAGDPQGLRLSVDLQRRRRGRRSRSARARRSRTPAPAAAQRLRRGRAPSARRPTSSPATSTWPKVLELTLHDGVDPRTGKQLGPAHRGAGGLRDLRRPLRRLRDASCGTSSTSRSAATTSSSGSTRRRCRRPSCRCSSTTASPAGRDYNAGGARYNTTYIQGVGHRHA